MVGSSAEPPHDLTGSDNTVKEGKRLFTNYSSPVKATPDNNTAVLEESGYTWMSPASRGNRAGREVVPPVSGS